uniref:Uncharacterized protein n=1 Tax=Anguilla anguilla TaxID=7936 RepID=A0A0E9XCL5_ANGAN
MARVLLDTVYHRAKGRVLVLDVLLVLAKGLVDLIYADLLQGPLVLHGDALQLVMDLPEVLFQCVIFFIHQALAHHSYQATDHTKKGVYGGSKGGDLLHATQNLGCCLFHLLLVCHVGCNSSGCLSSLRADDSRFWIGVMDRCEVLWCKSS